MSTELRLEILFDNISVFSYIRIMMKQEIHMSNETFDVRLSREQIEMINFALRNARSNFDDENLNEINMLIDMFENVEIDVLNSFVD